MVSVFERQGAAPRPSMVFSFGPASGRGFREVAPRLRAEARELGLVPDELHIRNAASIADPVDPVRLQKGDCRATEDNTRAERHLPASETRYGRQGQGKPISGCHTPILEDGASGLMGAVKTLAATPLTGPRCRSWCTAGLGRWWRTRPLTTRPATHAWPPGEWPPA